MQHFTFAIWWFQKQGIYLLVGLILQVFNKIVHKKYLLACFGHDFF